MIGASIPGIAGAFTAGLLSFLSPCILPLIPVYISIISGESAGDIRDGKANRFKILVKTLLFVFGFTLVFVTLALIFGGGMKFLGSSASLWITRIAGGLVIFLGANVIFDFIPALRLEKRFQTGGKKATPFLLGMAFAAGWTPCIGPILSSLLLYASQDGNTLHAALLLSVYSLGLGLPFIATALLLDRAQPLLGWFKKHGGAVKTVSGILLILLGAAMLAGSLTSITIFFLKAGYFMEEVSVTGPQWFRPIAKALATWLTFQGI